jgi:hypothetical protein
MDNSMVIMQICIYLLYNGDNLISHNKRVYEIGMVENEFPSFVQNIFFVCWKLEMKCCTNIWDHVWQLSGISNLY